MFLRSIIVTAVLCSNALAFAQPGTRDHRFRVDQDLDPLTVKLVHQVVNDLDPQGRVAIDGKLLKARINSEIASQTLIGALNALGSYTFRTGWPHGPLDRDPVHPDGLPKEVDTGNATQDPGQATTEPSGEIPISEK